MPRKKPFGGKQKKKQLQEKRKRKGEYEDNSDEESNRVKKDKAKVDTKEKTVDRKQDPHRYRLQFYKESNDVIKQRKLKAMEPLVKLEEKCLEVNMDIIYEPEFTPDIPKRPVWDYSLSKEKLEAKEEMVFKNYIDDLFERFNVEELSYFELNLETWRQLWRVLEVSDILLLISDIRHPMLNFSPALYHHVTGELGKPIILVLNKIDLVQPGLVIAWKEYLMEKFPKLFIICFSACQKFDITGGAASSKVHKHKKHVKYDAFGARELWHACEDIVQGKVDLSEWRKKIETDVSNETSESDKDHESVTEKQVYSYVEHELYKDGVLTIGCIGYPNVGKSSLINGLMGKKVVSVSRTPGHTKHFQTIYLTHTVKLCDCPGLVFPSLVEKSLQIIAGIYPIAQVRDPYTPIGYLAQRVNLPSLLNLQHPEYEENMEGDLQWSAVDICEAWAEKRRFYTSKAARPDISRAANHLLRLTVDGRIRLCFRPPGYADRKDYWAKNIDSVKLQTRSQIDDEEYSSGSEESDSQRNSDEEESGSDQSDEEPDQSITLSNPFSALS